MILVDTGYLVALLDPRDELHLRARAWSGRVRERLVLSEYVVWEAINRLAAPRNRDRATQLMTWADTPLEFDYLPASSTLFAAGCRLFRERADKEWSLTDCISFHVMKEHGIREALAHDEHFEQAGFVALLRHDP